MKSALACLMLAGVSIVDGAQWALADTRADSSGVWLRDDGNARVRIGPCGGNVCATNLWIGDQSGGEAPGDQLIMTVSPKSGNVLAGKAFDPKRNLTYKISITVAATRLTTRGCVVGGLVCKNVGWTRAK